MITVQVHPGDGHFDAAPTDPTAAPSALALATVFGEVFLANPAELTGEAARRWIESQAGHCDFDLLADSLDFDAGLEWLNLGLRYLVVSPVHLDRWRHHVPADRLAGRVTTPDECKQLAASSDPPPRVYIDSVLTDISTLAGRISMRVRPDGTAAPQEVGGMTVDLLDLVNRPEWVGQLLWERLRSDRSDGLVPTVVCDRLSRALGLAYSNQASLTEALKQRRGVYWSRSRNELWEKGATSGNRQQLLRIDVDCDQDAIRFTTDQLAGGFCHTGTYGCFGDDRALAVIERHLQSRLDGADPNSITYRLAQNPERLREKLIEEADELLQATDPSNAEWELADLLYFGLIALKAHQGELNGVFHELSRRQRRVSRRKPKGEIC